MLEQDYIQFEDYLSGELLPEDQALFEDRLKTDSEFKEAFKSYKDALNYLEHNLANQEKTEAFIANLNTVSSTYFNKETTQKSRIKHINPWYYSIAAAVILIFGFFIGQQFSDPVYSDYNDYGNISLTMRGAQDVLLNKAETAFNNKNFKDAEAYFSALLNADADNLELQLYQAVSLVELNDYKKADVLLERITQTPSVYKNKARWYLALSKLKQNDKEASMKVLKTIPEEANDYKQAQKLLKKLD